MKRATAAPSSDVRDEFERGENKHLFKRFDLIVLYCVLYCTALYCVVLCCASHIIYTKIIFYSAPKDFWCGNSLVPLPRILWCWVSFARAFLLRRLIIFSNNTIEHKRQKVKSLASRAESENPSRAPIQLHRSNPPELKSKKAVKQKPNCFP